jgi:hypothetical protein
MTEATDMPWLTILGVLAVLATVAATIALPPIQRRIFRANATAPTLVPLVAAGLAWLTASAFLIVKDQFTESSAPTPILTAFVEDINFGYPEVTDEYRGHSLTSRDLKEFAAQYNAQDETIRLSADEVARLNSIADQSGMADPVHGYSPYALSEVADKIMQPMAFYWEYTHWPESLADWSRALASNDNGDAEHVILGFVKQNLLPVLQSPGIFQALIGAADREDIDLLPLAGDCQARPVPGISSELDRDGTYYLVLPTVRMTLSVGDNEGRLTQAKNIAHLLTYACNRTLAHVFGRGADLLTRESKLMDSYIQAWNEIIKSRKSNSLSLTVTLSNLGMFDTFVRRDAKIVVGSLGKSANTVYTIVRGRSRTPPATSSTASQDKSPEGSELYIRVPSRSAVTIDFQAKLTDSLSDQLAGTFAGGLNFLRLGVLVSAGNNERVVLSATTPFSRKAREEAARMVQQVAVKLQ